MEVFRRVLSGDRWLALALAVPAWILARSFWLQEDVDPLSLPALLLDRFFQAITPLLIPAAVLILLSKRWGLQAATFTGAVGLMLGLAVVMSGIVRPPSDPSTVILACVVVTTSVVLLARYATRLPALRTATAGILAFALASVVPLLQLWSGTTALPSQTEASLMQDVKIGWGEATAQGLRMSLSYEAKNPTDSRVLVIVTRLEVCSWLANEPIASQRRHGVDGNCSVSRPIDAESWVSAGTSLKYSESHVIPVGRPRLTVRARVAYARGDRLRTSTDVEPRERVGLCSDVRFVRLQEESRIKSLAQDEKYLVYADLNSDGGLNYYFQAGSDFSKCRRPKSKQLERYFGTTEGTLIFDTWRPAKKVVGDKALTRTEGRDTLRLTPTSPGLPLAG